MNIRTMFADDINRKINGVIKVDQVDETTEREINEYVITKELKKHFISFFQYYGNAFHTPTDDIGVWISGFFGSGKSHFLKILSYILENKTINNVKTAERFRKKLEDDPAAFMLLDEATRSKAETILFNIDIEGPINKDKTAVLRVFAKMFYNHLGFYGENLKVAMLEYYIEQCGKTEEFRRVFEEKKGKPWVETRRAFAFNGKAIIPALMEVLDMSEEDARAWFSDKTSTELSIAQLVRDMKEYADSKPNDFQLLFMIDEVGQYVGTDTDMLLNLIRYIEDIKANLDNIVILMADDIRVDKIILRESVKSSLDRLVKENYIARSGELYHFLTDEEQDVQREITNSTHVDTSAIIERIANIIFGDIFNTPKFRYGKYDFSRRTTAFCTPIAR